MPRSPRCVLLAAHGSSSGGDGTIKSQALYDAQGRELLYILSFCLPRFMDLEFREKLATMLHELWHIGPRFDGDIRRHAGRCYAHSPSQQRYDTAMLQLADRWLALDPAPALHEFLRGRFEDLRRRYGCVWGVKVAHPKLLPITAEEARRIEACPKGTGLRHA